MHRVLLAAMIATAGCVDMSLAAATTFRRTCDGRRCDRRGNAGILKRVSGKNPDGPAEGDEGTKKNDSYLRGAAGCAAAEVAKLPPQLTAAIQPVPRRGACGAGGMSNCRADPGVSKLSSSFVFTVGHAASRFSTGTREWRPPAPSAPSRPAWADAGSATATA